MDLKELIVLFLAISSSLAIDYCSKDLKCQRTPHIACKNPLFKGGFGGKCVEPELIEMTDDLKKALVDLHNKYRNQQAKGETPDYDPATRMATLRWDDTLAKFAETNVRSCHYAHDPCHNTEHWSIAGQNIAKLSYHGHGHSRKSSNHDVILDLGISWFTTEYANGKLYGGMELIKAYNLPKIRDPKKHIGHFTQMVTDDAFAVGCAASRFKDGEKDITYLVCDYTRSNLNGASVYKVGPTASECKTGTNSKYPGLCSENEKFEAWYYV